MKIIYEAQLYVRREWLTLWEEYRTREEAQRGAAERSAGYLRIGADPVPFRVVTLIRTDPDDTVTDRIRGIAEVAGLKQFTTADGTERYIQTDDPELWSFQTQLADFLNQCLDHPPE